MEVSPLPFLEVGAPNHEAEFCVIWMHGLGADGHDFEDVASALADAAMPRKWRFVLPHAPSQRVTINMGAVMPAWYDILELEHPRAVDWGTVEASRKAIEALMAKENAEKIVLAGFSQGAALALHVGLRHQTEIAGILALSGYLLESDAHPAPEKAAEVPVGIFHGKEDSVVPFAAAQEALASLRTIGFTPDFKAYEGLDHGVSPEEIRDVYGWLESRA